LETAITRTTTGNRPADYLVERFSRLGAEAVVPLGKGNEATNSAEVDFMALKESLFKNPVERLGLEERKKTYAPFLLVQEDKSLTGVLLAQPEEVADNLGSITSNSPVWSLTVAEPRKLFDSTDR
jgi:NADPH-ferrihemoprotein reductase